MSSLKPEDCLPDWGDLEDKWKTVLNECYTFVVRDIGQVRPSSAKLYREGVRQENQNFCHSIILSIY